MKFTHLLLITLMSTTIYAQLKPVSYSDATQKLNGFSISPTKKLANDPGILILPAWKGIDAHAKESAEKLAKMGYITFIADIYGEGNYPQNEAEAGKQAGFYKQNFKDYQRRISLALAQLIKSGANADNIVAIGYCFGGTGVLEAARAGLPLRGVVSFHGGLGKDAARTAELIATKVLVCHGADDPYVSKAEIDGFQQEMRDGKADWQMIYYSNAVHSFTDIHSGNDNSKGAAYNEKADKRSWEHFITFLKETLL